MIRRFYVFLPVFFIFFVENTAVSKTDSLQNMLIQYAADQQSLDHFYFISWSDRYFDRMLHFTGEWQNRLQEISFTSLSPVEKVDYLLFQNELVYQKKLLSYRKSVKEETGKILPFAEKLYSLEETRWLMPKMDPEKSAAQLSEIAKAIKEMHQIIESAPKKENSYPAVFINDATVEVSPVFANRAAGIGDSMLHAIEYWYSQYNDYFPSFGWWCKTPYESVEKELKDYVKYLRETIAGQKGNPDDPLIGNPAGSNRLGFELAHEMIPYTPVELLRTGEKEFAWCRIEMKKAAQEMGFGDNWKAALDKVKNNHVAPGEQDQLVAKMAHEAIQFMDNNNLVTIPALCRETWRVEMLSQESQKTLPFAAYGGQNMLVAYSAAGMDFEQKQMAMKGNNANFMRIVTAHELIPGHHLQGFMAQRLNTQRRIFSTPFAVEGWAVYWEMLLWDMNYPQTPEDRIGMLFWRMARCARIIVSLKFHLDMMTPPEMVQFMVDEAGLEKEGATSEVRRYIGEGYGPLYQCAYMIGGLQLRTLRKEIVDSGKMSVNQFHDEVLSQNTIPIAMTRVALTKQDLNKDNETGWKFLE